MLLWWITCRYAIHSFSSYHIVIYNILGIIYIYVTQYTNVIYCTYIRLEYIRVHINASSSILDIYIYGYGVYSYVDVYVYSSHTYSI